MNRSQSSRRLPISLLLATGLALACRGDSGTPLSPRGSLESARRGGSTGVTVTAASPSFGMPGTINESVTITGSGFQNGAQAAWLLLNDSLDTTITVLSTQFVDTNTVTSVISISSKSPIAFRNVRVTNADRTKGIGNSVFEVTQAIPVPGTGDLQGVTDNGEFAGNVGATGVVWWSAAAGLVTVDTGSPAALYISPGGSAILANGLPRLYTRTGPVGAPWVLTKLPADSANSGGGAFGLIVDPITDQPLLIVGRVKFSVSKSLKGLTSKPIVWSWNAGTGSWQMLVLPLGTQSSASARAISTDTTIVGWLGFTSSCCESSTGTSAVVWHRNNTGAWQVTTIGPVGSGANGINAQGTTIVGTSGGQAVYWSRGAGGSWAGPITLPGACSEARGIDNAGDILLAGCSSSSGEPAGVMVPPYSAANIRFLGGLGRQNAAGVAAISPSGQYVAGSAGSGGVYWKLY